MTLITTKPDSSQPRSETATHLFDDWFDPINGRNRLIEPRRPVDEEEFGPS